MLFSVSRICVRSDSFSFSSEATSSSIFIPSANSITLVIDSKPLSKGQRARAKIRFERDYGCTACHQAINLAGKSRGGISGPSLVDAGNRLNADWIYRWLMNPRAYILKRRMPIYKLNPEEAAFMVKYIMTLKTENLR